MTYCKRKYVLLADARIPRLGVKRKDDVVELSDMQFHHIPIMIRRKLSEVKDSKKVRGAKKAKKSTIGVTPPVIVAPVVVEKETPTVAEVVIVAEVKETIKVATPKKIVATKKADSISGK